MGPLDYGRGLVSDDEGFGIEVARAGILGSEALAAAGGFLVALRDQIVFVKSGILWIGIIP